MSIHLCLDFVCGPNPLLFCQMLPPLYPICFLLGVFFVTQLLLVIFVFIYIYEDIYEAIYIYIGNRSTH